MSKNGAIGESYWKIKFSDILPEIYNIYNIYNTCNIYLIYI